MLTAILNNDSSTAFNEFINHFEQKKETNNDIICKCPSCGKDKLYITIKDKGNGPQIMLNCFHGCDYKDILNAAGLEPKQLYLSKQQRLKRENCSTQRTHIYCSKDGKPLFKKTIYKFFSFWEYNGKQKFPGEKETFWEHYNETTKQYEKGGSCRVLYHLDKLQGNTVYIPEGEKDVETLEKMGFIATTNPGGAAETWNSKKYAEQLAGIKEAYILADNDAAGTKHAEQVANYLTKCGIVCKIIAAAAIYPEAQNKWDISDIVTAVGADKAKELLLNAANTAPAHQITAAEQEAEAAHSKRIFDNPYNADATGKLTIANLTAALEKMDIQLKRNMITHDIDYSGAGIKDIDICGISAVLPVKIYDTLQFYLKGCSIDKISSMLNSISFSKENEYNPILEEIDRTKWDGKDRFFELCNIATIDPADKLSQALFKKWLMQCYCGLHNPPEDPFSLDLVLVLVGKQGTGKTRLLEKLSLSRKYFGEGLALDPRDKDSRLQVTSRWITELGEIGSTMKKEIDALKAFISNASDTNRPPYARGSITYPRTTSFCGTTNDIEFLIDETGNRRFATVKLQDNKFIDVKSKEFKEFDTLQLWAQIAAIVNAEIKAGGSYASVFRLSREERAELDKNNTQHTKPLKGEQEVIDLLAGMTDKPDFIITAYKKMTVTEFIKSHDELKKYSSSQIGKVLKKIGHTPERKKVGGVVCTLYSLPIIQSRIDAADRTNQNSI